MQRTPIASIAATFLLLSFTLQFAEAKRKTPRFIQQVPQLDTSVLPRKTHFELTIKHTEMIRPQNPARLLRAEAKVVRLQAQADETAVVLRGKVAEETPATPLQTREHGVRPLFHLDLKKLEANLAPELEHQMEAQIAAVRRKIAGDVERQERQMEREFAGRKPVIDVPSNSPRLSSDLGKTVRTEVDRSKQQSEQTSGAGQKQLKLALAGGGGKAPVMPLGGGPGGAQMPPVPLQPVHAPGIGSTTKVDVHETERQMQAELDSAKNHVSSSTSDLSAQMANGRKISQKQVQYVQPTMDAVLTHLRAIPPASIPSTTTAVNAQLDSTETIQWDQWHSRFAGLASDPILQSVKKLGNPSGSNTIEITVYADRHLTAKIAASGDKKFDQAILQAYESLNRNSGLTFPAGSRRTSVTFLIDNEHKGAGAPSGVSSQTSIGDKEVVHH